jgi:hypothetical protein
MICELGTVASTLNIALRWYFSRWLVHWQVQHRGWRCLQDCVALVRKSVANSQPDSAPGWRCLQDSVPFRGSAQGRGRAPAIKLFSQIGNTCTQRLQTSRDIDGMN